MGRKKKNLILAVAVDLLFCLVFVVALKNLWVPLVLNGILLVMAAGIIFLDRIARRTQWYRSLFVDYGHEIYPDNEWYRKHAERNFDVVVLGSSSAKYAYDFSDSSIKGMNWAQAPQTLVDDYRLLRNFHSILRENGNVIVNIMPFTSLNKETGLYDVLKYAGTLDDSLLDGRFRDKALSIKAHPVQLLSKSLKAVARMMLRKERAERKTCCNENPMSEEELRKDAASWIDGWKKQFCIESLEEELTEENRRGQEFRSGIMRELIAFCEERGYKVTFVLLPVTGYLREFFTPGFMERYVYDFIGQFDGVDVIDLLEDPDFRDVSLFRNSFFLNDRGALLVTRKVLERLN